MFDTPYLVSFVTVSTNLSPVKISEVLKIA
jgi:hypothetical protein